MSVLSHQRYDHDNHKEEYIGSYGFFGNKVIGRNIGDNHNHAKTHSKYCREFNQWARLKFYE